MDVIDISTTDDEDDVFDEEFVFDADNALDIPSIRRRTHEITTFDLTTLTVERLEQLRDELTQMGDAMVVCGPKNRLAAFEVRECIAKVTRAIPEPLQSAALCPCAICYDTLLENQVAILPCGHNFHRACLDGQCLYAQQNGRLLRCARCMESFHIGDIRASYF